MNRLNQPRPVKYMKVCRVDREDGRTVLSGFTDGYHLIGAPGCPVQVGDVVPYEPYGANFGWLIEPGER